MIPEILTIIFIFLQAIPSSDPLSAAYNLLQQGGLLMGALIVIYGQHRLYRYMIDKLEEKHRDQVEWLEGELGRLSQAFLYKSNQDTDMIKDLTRQMQDRTRGQ